MNKQSFISRFKNSNFWVIAFLFSFIISIGSCGGNSNSAKRTGQQIFRSQCVLCHGIDGTLGTNGAKNLQLSTMTLGQRVHIITKGKKVMTPFEGRLTESEIKAVAEYTMTIKK